MITPNSIYSELNEYVKGQDTAKKTISVAIYNHYIRCKHPELNIKKSNILMFGPSGSGKTYMIECLSKMFSLPISIVDATSLTQAGYVGQDVENCIIQLLDAADGDVKLAEKGIVFVDEIDKLAKQGVSNTGGRDISGEGVQQALLKLIEGTKVKLNYQSPLTTAIPTIVDTSNILFICAGAFDGLNISYKNSMLDALYQYGMTSELLGRLPILISLGSLSVGNMKEILQLSKESILNEYIRLFDYNGCKLSFTEEAINYIAAYASKSRSGARSLRSLLELILLNYQFQFPNLDKIEITEFDIMKTLKERKELN